MLKIAVLLPCHNEEQAIATVVDNFKQALPQADIYVYDNNSSDDTVNLALSAGAIVKSVTQIGKGNVVRAMFREIDADIYLLSDGDGTYPAAEAQNLITALIEKNADMVVATRMKSYSESKSRFGHKQGNQLISHIVSTLFNTDINDILSGYRLFSRRFVKSAPLFSKGFEVETILSIHAVEVDAKVIEIPINYASRAEGSKSKLNTFSDGRKIFLTIAKLFFLFKPFQVFGFIATVFFLSAIIIGGPVIIEYLHTGLVPKFPSAILASALMLLAGLSLSLGIILQAIAHTRRELKKIAFISR